MVGCPTPNVYLRLACRLARAAPQFSLPSLIAMRTGAELSAAAEGPDADTEESLIRESLNGKESLIRESLNGNTGTGFEQASPLRMRLASRRLTVTCDPTASPVPVPERGSAPAEVAPLR